MIKKEKVQIYDLDYERTVGVVLVKENDLKDHYQKKIYWAGEILTQGQIKKLEISETTPIKIQRFVFE